MSTKRSVIEIIDEMLTVIPGDQTELVGALDILVQIVQAAPGSGKPHARQYDFLMENLVAICEQKVGNPTEAWHFQLASILFNRPIGVVKEFHDRYQKGLV